jgi:diguanylate cyclase (GGDEF)-like protein
MEEIASVRAQGSAHRILVIDDNESIHRDIRKILVPPDSPPALATLEAQLFGPPSKPVRPVETTRFDVDSALQGRDGYQMLLDAIRNGRPFELAYVDVRMPPGWDGIETIAHLWEADPALQVVICTAHSDYSWGDIVDRLGQSDSLLVLKKPFDIVELLQSAHTMTRKWVAQRQARLKMNELEALVEHRTHDIERINRELELEVAERKRAEDGMKHLATHDPLTGLPNRMLFADRLGHACARARRSGRHATLVLIDVDHFKQINDSLGHQTGDRVLQEVARRLQGCTRSVDTVARLAGDEFVLILEDLDGPESATPVVDRVMDAFHTPFTVDGHSVNVTLSVGISICQTSGVSQENLIKTADLALYEAKSAGRNTFRFYRPGGRLGSEVLLSEELRAALNEDQLELWYQPLYGVQSGSVTGVEALLRWRHPQHGLVPPMEFIPIAEKSGAIVPIGEWVIRTACREAVAWQRESATALTVAVNVSAGQLYHDRLVDVVEGALRETGMAPHLLEIELTETAAMRDVERTRRVLARLHDLGVRIVIDDFGSGHSSLARLRQLAVDALKIDRTFLQDITASERDAAIVAAIIALANSLGIQVVAEGVETAEQLAFLKNLKWRSPSEVRCERVQGFLLSKPMPVSEAKRFLAARPKSEVVVGNDEWAEEQCGDGTDT